MSVAVIYHSCKRFDGLCFVLGFFYIIFATSVSVKISFLWLSDKEQDNTWLKILNDANVRCHVGLEPTRWFVRRKCCEIMAVPRCFKLKAPASRPRGNPAVLSIRGTTLLVVCVVWERARNKGSLQGFTILKSRKKENVHFFENVWSHTKCMALSNEINCIWNHIKKTVILSLISHIRALRAFQFSQDRKEIQLKVTKIKGWIWRIFE